MKSSVASAMRKLVGELSANGCTYYSIEFDGPLTASLSISERMTMSNLAMEMGVKNAAVYPDDKTAAYLRERHAIRRTAATLAKLRPCGRRAAVP